MERKLQIETIPKNNFAPKSPKGGFFKLLIFIVFPLGRGQGLKSIKISSLCR